MPQPYLRPGVLVLSDASTVLRWDVFPPHASPVMLVGEHSSGNQENAASIDQIAPARIAFTPVRPRLSELPGPNRCTY